MRNYVKLRAAKWAFHGTGPLGNLNGHLYAFGADDSDLFEKVAAANAANTQSQPTETWTYENPIPQDIFWLLDKQSLADFFNSDAQWFWFNSKFGLSEAGAAPPLFSDRTSIDKSPRSTWPTSAGTDGQRLRKGTSKTTGAALNYLAELFFFTSDQQFKDLWDSLEAGKISSDEALAAAAILVKNRG